MGESGVTRAVELFRLIGVEDWDESPSQGDDLVTTLLTSIQVAWPLNFDTPRPKREHTTRAVSIFSQKGTFFSF